MAEMAEMAQTIKTIKTIKTTDTTDTTDTIEMTERRPAGSRLATKKKGCLEAGGPARPVSRGRAPRVGGGANARRC